MSTHAKIAEIEAEMARTQKNKATNAHMGLLRAKISKLRAMIITDEGSKGGGGGGQEFEVKSTGDARVGLVGFPSVGKSTLMCKLTNTESLVADYEFTTVTCVPGIFRYKGAKVQLLDLPGIIEGAKDGKGRGKQVISTVMTCSLICIVLDSTKPLTHKKIIEKELYGFGVRLNKRPPNISVAKRENGGINISQAAGVKLYGLDKDTVSSICKEYRISNASIVFHSSSNADDLIDVLEGSRRYIPCIYVLNKIDAITIEELEILGTHPHYVPISANKEWNLDILLEKMWAYMKVIRVYTKPKGEIPDYEEPVILPINSTIEDFCRKIHKGLMTEFSFANIWGISAKYNGQKVGKDHMIEDEDVIQVSKKI